jgi:hypothetical protein
MGVIDAAIRIIFRMEEDAAEKRSDLPSRALSHSASGCHPVKTTMRLSESPSKKASLCDTF